MLHFSSLGEEDVYLAVCNSLGEPCYSTWQFDFLKELYVSEKQNLKTPE